MRLYAVATAGMSSHSSPQGLRTAMGSCSRATRSPSGCSHYQPEDRIIVSNRSFGDSLRLFHIRRGRQAVPRRGFRVVARNRILFEGGELRDGRRLRLTAQDERAQHIRSVLRSTVGDAIRVGQVGGWRAVAEVAGLEPSGGVHLDVLEWQPPLPGTNVHLVLALPRPKVLRRLLPSLASLGVNSVSLVAAEKVERSYFASKVLRPDKVRRELLKGLEQAGDTVLPWVGLSRSLRPLLALLADRAPVRQIWGVDTLLPAAAPSPPPAESGQSLSPQAAAGLRVEPAPPWTAMQRSKRSSAVKLVADPCANTPLLTYLHSTPASAAGAAAPPTVLAFGPEGGWTPDEVTAFRGAGFQACTLGSRTLTTADAVLASLGTLLAFQDSCSMATRRDVA